jgi:putative hemolysin
MTSSQPPRFSYATETDPRLKRLLIRAIERMTGQPHLKRLYEERRATLKDGDNFWEVAVRSLELTIHVNDDGLMALPRTGPLVIVANHPFGVLDGIVISYLVSQVRNDFLVLTNRVLYQAPEIQPYLLPIDFAETKEALATNLRSRAEAKAHLDKGGCVVVFPAGGASTVPRPWSRRAVDLEWKSFTAKLIATSKAPVVPVYFAGQNSRLFQIASHISLTLRLSLFFQEVYNKIGSDIYVRVGTLILHEYLAGLDRKRLMEHLRAATYALGAGVPDPAKPWRRRLHRTRRSAPSAP